MQTTNLISTPDITGNIGSCGSSSIDVISRYGALTEEHTTIVTNSCTGENKEYHRTVPSDWAGGVMFIGLIMVVVTFVITGVALLEYLDNKHFSL